MFLKFVKFMSALNQLPKALRRKQLIFPGLLLLPLLRFRPFNSRSTFQNLSTAQSARPPDKRYARGPGYDRSRSPSDRSSRGPPAPSSLAARGLHNSRSRSPFNPRDRDLRSSSYRSNEEDFGGRRGHDGFDYNRAEKTASVAGDDALWHSLKGAVGNAVDTDYFLSQWNSVISSDSAEGTRPADDRLGPDSSDARAGPSGHRMNSDSRARDRTSVSSVGSARDPSGGIRDPLSSSRTAGRAPSASSPLVSQCKNKLAALQRYLGSGACDTLDDQDFVLKLGDLLKKIKDIPP